MNDSEYLVEMKLSPVSGLPSPQDAVHLTERFVLPTLEGIAALRNDGRIIAGGPVAGAMSFSFVVRSGSPRQVEETVMSLPLWSRSETTIVPLGDVNERAALVRQRLEKIKATASANSRAAAPSRG